MTYEEINAAYRDLQGYYIEKIEEACNGQDRVRVNLIDERDIMLDEGGYLPEQDSEFYLTKADLGYTLQFINGWDDNEWQLESIGVDGLRDILQAITK